MWGAAWRKDQSIRLLWRSETSFPYYFAPFFHPKMHFQWDNILLSFARRQYYNANGIKQRWHSVSSSWWLPASFWARCKPWRITVYNRPNNGEILNAVVCAWLIKSSVRLVSLTVKHVSIFIGPRMLCYIHVNCFIVRYLCFVFVFFCFALFFGIFYNVFHCCKHVRLARVQ